jgi:hypothetical protein
MKRVTVHYSKPTDLPVASIFLKPLNALWAVTGGLIPAFLVWGVVTHGSPALFVAHEGYRCAYLDAFGGFYSRDTSNSCHWFAFRKLDVSPQKLINDIQEGFSNVPSND